MFPVLYHKANFNQVHVTIAINDQHNQTFASVVNGNFNLFTENETTQLDCDVVNNLKILTYLTLNKNNLLL